MLARVSNIEAFRQWKASEDQSVEDLIYWLTTDNPSELMLAGTAFHKALELVEPGEHETLSALGFTFLLPEGEIALPSIRELRAYGQYGALEVTGCVDGLRGRRVNDHKTTGRCDPERYLSGYNWRFYLDLLDADEFVWDIYEIDEIKPRVYRVSDPQTLRQYRYPGMHEDCERLAAEFYDFARVHLPDFNAMAKAA